MESTTDRFFLSGLLRSCIWGLGAIYCLHAGHHQAHARQAPLVETRGVWFATVLGDGGWPSFPSDPAGVQEADLRSIIREIHALGLNTLVFQAVARGDAMYPSTRLPWSARLGGPGQDPGYDPLAVAIDECRRLGLELHVWFNVYRVGDLSTIEGFDEVSDPGHVYYEQPGWVDEREGQLWIDPSSADARDWLVANVKEIVDGYDLDAVHFDFIRYPTGGLSNDLANFQFDPRGFNDIDDWRRDNVTLFVDDVSAEIFAAKPWVKVGSAPFGNYQNFDGAWPAAWAYSDVFQESRRWLAEGTHDYLAPQIYFDIGREPEPPNAYDSPDFAYLIDDWVANSSNRPIFAGHGPYKSVVIEELGTQISRARTAGAAGQFFFRFDHIRTFDFADAYPTRSLPAAMPHRFELQVPSPPTSTGLTSQPAGGDSTAYTLSWEPSSGSADDPLFGYAVFAASGRDPMSNDAADYLRTVPSTETEYRETLPGAIATDRRYTVVAVSRLGGRSAPGGVATSTDRVAADLDRIRIAEMWPLPVSQTLNVVLDGGNPRSVRLSIVDVTGRDIQVGTVGDAGSLERRLEIDMSGFATGVYVLVVRTGSEMDSRRVVVTR